MRRSPYQNMIEEIDPTVNGRHVEASMRVQYGTLDHLPRETFREEIAIFKACEAEQPGFGERVAQSMGL